MVINRREAAWCRKILVSAPALLTKMRLKLCRTNFRISAHKRLWMTYHTATKLSLRSSDNKWTHGIMRRRRISQCIVHKVGKEVRVRACAKTTLSSSPIGLSWMSERIWRWLKPAQELCKIRQKRLSCYIQELSSLVKRRSRLRCLISRALCKEIEPSTYFSQNAAWVGTAKQCIASVSYPASSEIRIRTLLTS